jgi:hypothetical protein
MIVKNAVYCKLCKTEIESKHRHDFVLCPCGNIAVDGGHVYTKRSLRGDPNSFEDRSVEQ